MFQSMADAWVEEGLEKGLAKGREEGREEGLEKGVVIGRIQLLESLLNLSTSPIRKFVTQSVDELLQMEAELKAKLANRS